MSIAKGTIVASRYELVERLGTGSMGEVWRAHDTRFESRFVAVKFLRDDNTLEEDALNRDRLVTRIEQHIDRGELTLQRLLEAFGSVLSPGPNSDALHAKIEERLGTTGPYQPEEIAALFDELASEPDFNEHARMRAKLRRFFKDEANSVATLRHDNIVSIFDYGEHDRNPYLVMDFIDGRTLLQVIEDRELLSRVRQLRLMEDLCAGLGYAHHRKLVHRDIKPANLIIDSATNRLKILDFGVVRRLGMEATVGVAVGTFSYMSPEQSTGAATLDHRSDIFSVGLVFYELLSGRKAFPPGRGVGELLRQLQQESPTPLRELVPDLQPEIEDIITRAVEKAPERRYQDLSAMEREIARVRARLEITEQADRSVFAAAETIILKAPRSQPTVREPVPGTDVASAPAAPAPPAPFAPPVPVATPASPSAPTDKGDAIEQRDEERRDEQGKAPTPPTLKPGLSLPLALDKKSVPLVAAAALLVAVVAVTIWALGSSGTPGDAPPQEPTPPPQAAAPVSDAPPSPPPPPAPTAEAPVALTEVTIDLRPWARVRIVPPSADVQVPSEPLFTPFTLDLPPGDYTLECENGGITRPAKITLTVAAGPRQFFTRNMPGFNATTITDALLGREQ